jgi:phenylalanyl-tRNA synthetase beta chain
MFELGQPLHAFDYDKLVDSRIRVRRARSHERLTTLDGVDRQLHDGDLLICDGKRPVALGGVMGGLDTEVTEKTSRVLLEAAGFDPGSVRRTVRRLGLHSEASYRFERHVDTGTTELASRRAAELLARLGGGRVAAGSVDAHPRPAAPRTVSIRVSRTQQLTGVPVDAPTITGTLQRLGLVPSAPAEDISVTVPTFRPDLEREVDLIEEVLRLHGFENVPATIPYSEVPPRAPRDPRRSLARRALTAAGMSEAITFGFTSPQRVASLRLPESDLGSRPVRLRNPMTVEQSVMRTSLVPNLLGAVQRNVAFGITDVRLFEIGSVFLSAFEGRLPEEPVHVAGVITGTRPTWLEQKPPPVDVFDLKGIVERLLGALLGDAARTVQWLPARDVPWLHPGVAATIALPTDTDLASLGVIGEVHPETRAAFDLGQPCFAFDLDLTRVPLPEPAQMRPISRHPAVTRDVSFLVDAAIPAARIAEFIADAREPLVEDYGVLEDFRDPAHVPAGKKGMLWTITYRAGDRTLTDAEVDRAHEGIVQRLLSELDAQRR